MEETDPQGQLFLPVYQDMQERIRLVREAQNSLKDLLADPEGKPESLLGQVFSDHPEILGFAQTQHPVPYHDENVYPDFGGFWTPPTLFVRSGDTITQYSKQYAGWEPSNISQPLADAATKAQEILNVYENASWISHPEDTESSGVIMIITRKETFLTYGSYTEDREGYEGNDPDMLDLVEFLNSDENTRIHN